MKSEKNKTSQPNSLLLSLSVLCSLTQAAILLHAAWDKVSGHAQSKLLFQDLGMEPTGRLIIGLLEAFAAFLLLTRRYTASGALLSLCIMLGALIAHSTKIGFDVHGDGGRLAIMMGISTALSIGVMLLERHSLPIVGKLFRADN